MAIVKTHAPFQLKANFVPTGDQPKAIEKLVQGVQEGKRHQALLGATGTGKTFTMANVIQKTQKPTLILAHNKTLAAQLCNEFKEFFPENAVAYFVSYYDYYQPEAYMPRTDTYIEKEATINEEIDRYRHSATLNLLTRDDVIIVASVSCIYGLGRVEDYEAMAIPIQRGSMVKRDALLRKLTEIQYVRCSTDFKPGMFHVMGDTVEVFPPSSERAYRLEFFGDEIEEIREVDPFTGEVFESMEEVYFFPSKHSVTTPERLEAAITEIEKELEVRVKQLQEEGRIIEAERIKTRTEYDIEMLRETGYCNGIENYTRYLSGLDAGMPPATLIDYFPKDFLLLVDESHITIPQIGGMHNGNYSRKRTLVEHGFRLPSSHDNRPLKFDEFESLISQAVYVSATPGNYEKTHCTSNDFAEQIIRPTGLLDPLISVRPSRIEFWKEEVHTIAQKEAFNQIDDLTIEIEKRIKRNERVLVTTVTKKMAEKLAEYFSEIGIKTKYLHSEIETFERIETLRLLREGVIDVIVGINLLREGLDLPEVSLVAILDADKKGFLRSRDALIQVMGRAARNSEGMVILYADVMTDSMEEAIGETQRRRAIQEAYNTEHGITPTTIIKKISDISSTRSNANYDVKKVKKNALPELIRELEQKLQMAVENLEFEKAVDLRDELEMLKREREDKKKN
ncbi:MAG: excinuclease ABC subunit UvrB [Candidatus Peregrinibacteria bacterium]